MVGQGEAVLTEAYSWSGLRLNLGPLVVLVACFCFMCVEEALCPSFMNWSDFR